MGEEEGETKNWLILLLHLSQVVAPHHHGLHCGGHGNDLLAWVL
jgi:hypothetical protein